MASLKVNLNTSGAPIGGTYPLIIKLIHKGIRIEIATPYTLAEKDFDQDIEKAVSSQDNILSKEKVFEINQYIFNEISELNSIIIEFDNSGKKYTVFDVINVYRQTDCSGEFGSYVRNLMRQPRKRGGKIGIYSNLLKQISQYHDKKRPLRFEDINKQWLDGFKEYLSTLNIAQSALQSYIRVFNDICDSACKKGVFACNSKSFFKNCYSVENKQYMNAKIVAQIETVDLKHDAALSFSRDILLFSYYTGMSFVCIMCLKRIDLHDGMIRYYKSIKNKRKICLEITSTLRTYIDKYNNGGEYVFPLMEDSRVDVESQCRIKLIRHNRELKRLSALLKLPISLNSNTPIKIPAQERSENTILLTASFHGNTRIMRIPLPPGENVERVMEESIRQIVRSEMSKLVI